MDYGFFQAFEQLCKDVAEIKASVATLAQQSDDRAAMAETVKDISAHGKALQDAVSGVPPTV